VAPRWLDLSQRKAKEDLDRQTKPDSRITDRSQAGPVARASEHTTPSRGRARPAKSPVGAAPRCTRARSSCSGGQVQACSCPRKQAAKPSARAASLKSYATSVTAPSARGMLGAGRGALSGADICPASGAASRCHGPVWCSQVGSRSTPRARWHSVAHWVSRSRLMTVAPYRSLPSSAPTSSRPSWLTPSRPEPGKRRLGPSAPRRSAPSCWPAPPAPASAVCASAGHPATCLAWLRHGRAV